MDQELESYRKRLKDRLQFVFVLTLFFPTMLAAIFGPSSAAGSSKNIGAYGLVICCLIIIYLYTELAHQYLSKLVVKICDYILLIDIASFAFIYYVFAAVQFGNIPAYFLYPFGLSIFGILLIPLGIILFLTGVTAFLEFKGSVNLFNTIKDLHNK